MLRFFYKFQSSVEKFRIFKNMFVTLRLLYHCSPSTGRFSAFHNLKTLIRVISNCISVTCIGLECVPLHHSSVVRLYMSIGCLFKRGLPTTNMLIPFNVNDILFSLLCLWRSLLSSFSIYGGVGTLSFVTLIYKCLELIYG